MSEGPLKLAPTLATASAAAEGLEARPRKGQQRPSRAPLEALKAGRKRGAPGTPGEADGPDAAGVPSADALDPRLRVDFRAALHAQLVAQAATPVPTATRTTSNVNVSSATEAERHISVDRRASVRPRLDPLLEADKGKSSETQANAAQPAAGQSQPANASASEASAPRPLEPPARVAPESPIAALAPVVAEDPSLHVTILPHVARVTLQTPDAAAVALRVAVRDGVADVEIERGSSLLDGRASELRAALAGEGLQLGQIRSAEVPPPAATVNAGSAGAGDRQDRTPTPDPGEREFAAAGRPVTAPTTTAAASAGTAPATARHGGSVHVRA